MDRRGFELAAGLIVILIASIVIFALAGTVTYKVLCSSESKLDSYSEQQRQALEKRLSSGSSVVVADAAKSADQPSSICTSKTSLGADYQIGVRNDGTVEDSFIAECLQVQLERPDGTLDPADPSLCSTMYSSVDTRPLIVGARGSIPVIVNLPQDADPGRYIITLDVRDSLVTFSRKVTLYLTLA